jgi:hypothetical protein
LLAGCKKPTPAGHYEKDGLSFEHLEGWTVLKDAQKRARTVTVEGPLHAVLTISVFAPHLEVSLRTFADAATKARSEAVKQKLTVAGVNLGAEAQVSGLTPIERSVAGTNAQGLEEHFTLEVIAAPAPHTAEFLLFNRADRALIVMDQVADRHRAEVNPGFQKILDSLKLAP